MKYVLDGQQMQALDNYSINVVKIPAAVLMERAALGVCSMAAFKYNKAARIVSICGMGNNGADAMACARILAEAGYDTAVCLIGNTDKATDLWKTQFEIITNLGIKVVTLDDALAYDVIIDGIFGIGLSREVTGIYKTAIERINESQRDVIAVDIPSGICATTGKVMGTAIKAVETVTFGYYKTGLVLYPGAEYAGNITLHNPGFAPLERLDVGAKKYLYEEKDLKKMPVRKQDSNKGTYGRVLIVAGSQNMSGAAYFAGKAAYRSGVGLVRLMTAESNREAIQKLLPEAVLCFYDRMEKEEIKEQVKWANVIVIGPGLSTGAKAKELVFSVLEDADLEDKKAVIDADALNILAQCGRQRLAMGCIITPHLGEMSRLTGRTIHEIKENIINEASDFAKENKCICILKDSRSIVSDGTDTYINVSGNSGMSTAGSGDVLTGIIAGMLANGMDKYDAAVLAVYIHGLAGDFAKEEFGEYSMTADDIADKIKNVIYK